MKLEYRSNKNFYKAICELTKELDKILNLNDFFRHYILIDDYYKDIKFLPIRVPGKTVGNIWIDDNNVITKIIFETNCIINLYPENINELVKNFIGTVIEY